MGFGLVFFLKPLLGSHVGRQAIRLGKGPLSERSVEKLVLSRNNVAAQVVGDAVLFGGAQSQSDQKMQGGRLGPGDAK